MLPRGDRGGGGSWLRQGDRPPHGRPPPRRRRIAAREHGHLQRVVRPRPHPAPRRHRAHGGRATPTVDRLDPHRPRAGDPGPRLREVGRPARKPPLDPRGPGPGLPHRDDGTPRARVRVPGRRPPGSAPCGGDPPPSPRAPGSAPPTAGRRGGAGPRGGPPPHGAAPGHPRRRDGPEPGGDLEPRGAGRPRGGARRRPLRPRPVQLPQHPSAGPHGRSGGPPERRRPGPGAGCARPPRRPQPRRPPQPGERSSARGLRHRGPHRPVGRGRPELGDEGLPPHPCGRAGPG